MVLFDEIERRILTLEFAFANSGGRQVADSHGRTVSFRQTIVAIDEQRRRRANDSGFGADLACLGEAAHGNETKIAVPSCHGRR